MDDAVLEREKIILTDWLLKSGLPTDFDDAARAAERGRGKLVSHRLTDTRGSHQTVSAKLTTLPNPVTPGWLFFSSLVQQYHIRRQDL